MALSGSTVAQRGWNFLSAKGLTPAGISGLIGNLDKESGLRPNNLQNTFENNPAKTGGVKYTDVTYVIAVDNGSYTNFVHDGAGFGLAQWTYWSRKQGLLDFVKKRGKSIADEESQWEYLWVELSTTFKSLLAKLKTVTSVQEASDMVLMEFEKPASINNPTSLAKVKEERGANAQIHYDALAKKTTTVKEESKLKLVQSILTKNPCYTAGRKITVKGLMLHSVGCPQPKASVFINNWNKASYSSACVHGFIDANDGTVYQTLPWNHRGWHCASGSKGSGNNTHIGVEMCEPACIKYTGGATFTCSDKATAQAAVKRTYEAAVGLFAMLCKEYNLDPLGDGVIISHKEGCARGIASNHGDPEHLWTQLGMGYTMNTFRAAVKAAMGGSTTASTPTTPTTPTTATTTACPYKVRVKATDLRIRKGPGTDTAIVKIIDPGVYTITEESTGKGATKWGKLKSGIGWISLDYATKV